MTQTKEQNQIKNETKGQHRVVFVDEDGDGKYFSTFYIFFRPCGRFFM